MAAKSPASMLLAALPDDHSVILIGSDTLFSIDLPLQKRHLLIHNPADSQTDAFNVLDDITPEEMKQIIRILMSLDKETPVGLDFAALVQFCLEHSTLTDIHQALRQTSQPYSESHLWHHFQTSLALWALPEVQRATNRSTFTGSTLMNRPIALILTAPARSYHAYLPYLHSVTARLVYDLYRIAAWNPYQHLPRKVTLIHNAHTSEAANLAMPLGYRH